MRQENSGAGSLPKQIALTVGQMLVMAGRPLVTWAAVDAVPPPPAMVTVSAVIAHLDGWIVDAELRAKRHERLTDEHISAVAAAQALREVRTFWEGRL